MARTALGPFGFDDVMVVRALEPGTRVVIEKVGRVLGGVVTVVVTPHTSALQGEGSTVRWHQNIVLPWVPRALRTPAQAVVGLLTPVVRAGYQHVVRRLLDQAQGARHDEGETTSRAPERARPQEEA